VHVLRLRLAIADAAGQRHRARPGAEIVVRADAFLGGERGQQRRAGAQVRADLALHRGHLDAGQLRGARERVAAQTEEAPRRLQPGQLLLALDHLPASLGVAPRLEQRHRHGELAGRSRERAVEIGLERTLSRRGSGIGPFSRRRRGSPFAHLLSTGTAGQRSGADGQRHREQR
jgi:hypothetical protein